MTLLITVFAAVITTVLWYVKSENNPMMLGTWSIDAVFEYAELGAEYFTPKPMDMLNDSYLGFSVVALGLVIWLVYVLIKDPKGTVRARLFQK